MKDGRILNYLNSRFNEITPRFSPDGSWIAYVSDKTGKNEVYIRGFPDTRGVEQISVGGGMKPVWNHDGNELFYVKGNKIISVRMHMTPDEIIVGEQRALFDIEPKFAFHWSYYEYDELNDRFLMISNQNVTELSEIRIIINWFDEVKRKDPTWKK